MRHHTTTIGEGTGTEFAVDIHYHRFPGERATSDNPGEAPSIWIHGVTLTTMTITTPKGSDVVVRREGFTADALMHIEAALHLIVEDDEGLIETLETTEPPRRDDDTREEAA